ncbi:hypothetical protein HYU11_00660 [Candidatus Woesearchaeota archaeon]|nr:hypothetical protein [Candidatus Woesearchaeota archaeon]
MKRGQITLFILVGFVVLFALGAFIFLSRGNAASVKELDVSPVRSYVESCLKKASDLALFEKVGKQGGYIDPKSLQQPLRYDTIRGYDIPFHFDSGNYYVPSTERISLDAAQFIASEVKSCSAGGGFEVQGYRIESGEPYVTVVFGEDQTVVSMEYDMRISRGASSARISSYSVVLPIRFLKVHSIGSCFIDELRPDPYSEVSEFVARKKCIEKYSGDGLIDVKFVYGMFVLVYDYSTWFENYGKTFKYQFGVDFGI